MASLSEKYIAIRVSDKETLVVSRLSFELERNRHVSNANNIPEDVLRRAHERLIEGVKQDRLERSNHPRFILERRYK